MLSLSRLRTSYALRLLFGRGGLVMSRNEGGRDGEKGLDGGNCLCLTWKTHGHV